VLAEVAFRELARVTDASGPHQKMPREAFARARAGVLPLTESRN
jgi:hypothetical protein